MASPCIITVAITGSLPKKKDNPAVPITPVEQVESTHEGFEAGATLVHLHVHASGSVNFPTRVYDNPPDLVEWLADEMLRHGVKPAGIAAPASRTTCASIDRRWRPRMRRW